MALSDFFAGESLTGIRARVMGYAAGAKLRITDWIVGAVGQQMLEAFVAIFYAKDATTAKYVRGLASLDTSVDPGDFDPYDPGNIDLPPERGLLSVYGENVYGVVRGEATFANGSVTFVNNGIVSRTIAPEGLVFTWTENSPPSPAPTYHNAPDAAVYTNPDGTLTIPVGGSAVLSVDCDTIGAQGSCPSGSLSMTTTLVGCAATNATPIVGTDREDAEAYRIKCRRAAARMSLGGPADIYAFLASKTIDGDPLYNAAMPPAPVAITRTAVSEDSATGIVEVYYATDAGAPTADDVTAANTNIELETMACPDTITFTGAGAIELPVTVTGAVWIKSAGGVNAPMIRASLSAAIAAYQPDIPIGGFKLSVGAAGYLPVTDLSAAACKAWPGIFEVVIIAPAGPVAVGANEVVTLNSPAGNWAVQIVP